MSAQVNEQYHYLDQHGRLTLDAEQALSCPFAVEDIKWRPQPTKKGMAIALPYADPRVYHERLDAVFGPANWSSTLQFIPAPYHVVTAERKNDDGTVWKPAVDFIGHKLFAIASVTVAGLGTKSSAGEAETDNENAATVSEAQAFKRACSMLGIGRYLYSIPQQELPFEKYKGFTKKPVLPLEAIPPTKCENCSKVIADFSYNNQQGEPVVMPMVEVIELSKRHFAGQVMCGPCVAQKRAEKKASSSATTSKKEKVA